VTPERLPYSVTPEDFVAYFVLRRRRTFEWLMQGIEKLEGWMEQGIQSAVPLRLYGARYAMSIARLDPGLAHCEVGPCL
jgi:hypothetical protein